MSKTLLHILKNTESPTMAQTPNGHDPIYKITDRQSWDYAKAQSVYAGSPDDLRDGFIHFSTLEQLRETARKHFAGRDGLVLIAVDPKTLGDALIWEPSRGGALFPHLYAPLATSHALWERDLPLQADAIPDVDAALKEV